ncbi:MAG: 3D domain-containing protein [Phycisphaeraceae bacterium]|nr:3D domain-containing protein [Phycisphaeraceae bacterium]
MSVVMLALAVTSVAGILHAATGWTGSSAPKAVELMAFENLPVKDQAPLELGPVTVEAAAEPQAPAPVAQVAKAKAQPPRSAAAQSHKKAQLYFDGRPIRAKGTVKLLVTGYSPDARSCGKFADGITASGKSVYTNAMKMVAADTRLLPFGSIVSVPGYNNGRPVPVLDRGGKIKGKRLDLLYPTHERAMKWGKKWVEVTVWEYAD